jgi:hypothetical protein
MVVKFTEARGKFDEVESLLLTLSQLRDALKQSVHDEVVKAFPEVEEWEIGFWLNFNDNTIEKVESEGCVPCEGCNEGGNHADHLDS